MGGAVCKCLNKIILRLQILGSLGLEGLERQSLYLVLTLYFSIVLKYKSISNLTRYTPVLPTAKAHRVPIKPMAWYHGVMVKLLSLGSRDGIL